ncbi:hypothetical protein FG442_002464 [Yersinia enterocolitica]|uniref:hypothetical protein n=1 Tax=Yersinia enterocolitica TaxID=630 RepID=UPI0028BA3F34|nr:hypothetical protein [Yersinia enterocolitica]EKN3965997.1 hypothetical protein [Yersinia enterocolitica]EKN4023226.1 hypothetical protein [Yersinia enterocolitica]EKN4885960.1 hypothetical protein [Yersinia enterocolitica]EKN4890542.1 hypothetical protein [Yersinia enterocolitica]
MSNLAKLDHYRGLMKPIHTNTGGGGGDGEMLETRVAKLESDTAQIKTDLAILTTRSEIFATKSDIESLRTEHQTLRAELAGEFGSVRAESASESSKLRSELSDRITAASTKASCDLNSFKSDLFWKIGFPLLMLLLSGFGGVIWAILKTAAIK